MRRVVVHIDRVTLRGVDPAERQEVLDGFKDALVEQLTTPGAAESLATMGHRPSLVVRVRPAPTGEWSQASGAALGRELTR